MDQLFSLPNLARLLRRPDHDPLGGAWGTFMARDALRLAASALDLGPSDTVLLPAYLCREVLRPFEGRCRVAFYDVQRDLTVDLELLRRLLAKDQPRLLLYINYFGFLQPVRAELRSLCEEAGVVLLEDAAHSLLTTGSGATGDWVVDSFRKLLPLPDGGGIKIRAKSPAVMPRIRSPWRSNVLSMLGMTKALIAARSTLLSRSGLAQRTQRTQPTGRQGGNASPSGESAIMGISSFARNGLGNIPREGIRARRRSDYHYWESVAARHGRGQPVFPTLPLEVCPLGFPILLDDRDSVKARMDAVRPVAKVHWRLPASIGPEFTVSQELSTRMLTLPVYPDLRDRDRERLTAAFIGAGA